ncbi:cytoadherence linked asexual protein 3.1, putative [Plasmodium sp. gorilla clade G3]|nr:cytoadherence linked asexual protein 3.1, putative [Plasmodium sp. gorilla clade G3]
MVKKSKDCEYDNYCYKKEEEGGDPSSSLCESRKGSASGDNECNIGKGWKNAKSVYQTRGGDTVAAAPPELEDVFLPTRRQCICTQNLSGVTSDKLLDSMMKISVHQGHNLGQYYKNKGGGGNSKSSEGADGPAKPESTSQSGHNTTTYDVSACNAMKYSFYDLRDIILGYDQLETQSNGIETSLKQVFESGGDGEPGSGNSRQGWWETNKECVWKSMLCGYKQGHSGGFRRGEADKHDHLLPSGCTETAPEVEHFPLPKKSDDGKTFQFLRWFAEWSEDFCKQHKVQKDMLSESCKCYKCNGQDTESGGDDCSGCKDSEDCDGSTDCGTEKTKCTSQCKIYQQFIQQWQSQYEKQRDKYTEDKGKHSEHPVAKSAGSTREYLKEQLNKICPTDGGCNCMGDDTSGGEQESLPRSLQPIPEGYAGKCSGVKDQEGENGGGISEKPFQGGTEMPPEDDGKGGGKSKGEAGAGGDGVVEPSPEGASPPDGGVWGKIWDLVGTFTTVAVASVGIAGKTVTTAVLGGKCGTGGGQVSGDQVGGGTHTTHGSESDGHSHGSQEGGANTTSGGSASPEKFFFDYSLPDLISTCFFFYFFTNLYLDAGKHFPAGFGPAIKEQTQHIKEQTYERKPSVHSFNRNFYIELINTFMYINCFFTFFPLYAYYENFHFYITTNIRFLDRYYTVFNKYLINFVAGKIKEYTSDMLIKYYREAYINVKKYGYLGEVVASRVSPKDKIMNYLYETDEDIINNLRRYSMENIHKINMSTYVDDDMFFDDCGKNEEFLNDKCNVCPVYEELNEEDQEILFSNSEIRTNVKSKISTYIDYRKLSEGDLAKLSEEYIDDTNFTDNVLMIRRLAKNV